MQNNIFDIKDKKIVVNEHILLIKPLKELYSKEHGLEYIAYCFYMTCPYDDVNPFTNTLNDIKSNMILKYLGLNSIPNDVEPLVNEAITFFNNMYDSPLMRMYQSIKSKVDDLATFLNNTKISEKNIKDILTTIRSYKDIIEPYKSAYKDVIEERSGKIKGGQMKAYDQ